MMNDRVILVTGSAEGIGFATAELCHGQGASVMLHGLDGDKLKDAASRIGPNVGYVVADLLEATAPQNVIDSVISQFGRIDGLVNNAARLDRGTIETLSDEFFDLMMVINVRAPLRLIQAATQHMSKNETGGSIVNIGSINALCGAPNLLVYSATKAALSTATRNLGDALSGRSVRVNQINVGWTVTESENRIQKSEGQPENWQEQVPHSFRPSGALLTPEQVAEHVAFWLSPNSAPVTGQVYEVEQYPLIGRIAVTERHSVV